jgi:hypothetical protein
MNKNVNYDYFLLHFISITTITTMMAMTIKIPKPIPALKIPVTTEQELNSVERNSITPIVTGFIFFKV